MQARKQRRIEIGELPEPFIVRPVKQEGIERYDIDNSYPTRIERIINSSVTAKQSARMLSRFIIGKGFKNEYLNNLVVGKDRYERPVTALKLLKQIAISVAYFSGFYVRAQYDGNLNVTGFMHEDFKNCRFGLKDSQEYSGKIVIYNNWDKSKSTRIDKKKFITVNVWNNNLKVIESQIKKAKSIVKYRGQVYFNFLDEYYIYPQSMFDPVQYDADTENQISRFKNGELRRGFFMKKIIHHTTFESDKDAMDFKDKLMQFQGGGHELSFMVLEGTFDDTGKLIEGENIKIEDIKQNINDKIFEIYEKSCINNIRKAAYAIPQILIDYEDGKLGTTSGEALFQASRFYNDQTDELRSSVEQSFKEMFSIWKDEAIRNEMFEIEPLILGAESSSTVTNIALRTEKQ